MRYLFAVILLLLVAVPVAAVDSSRFVAGDILGWSTSNQTGYLAIAKVVDGTTPLYTTYDVVLNGTRWEIPKYWHGELEVDEQNLIANLHANRVAHVDPILVTITDPTITGGDMKYTGLSLAEALAGVVYPIEPAPGEPAGISPLYVVGDILDVGLVASVSTSGGQTSYRTYDSLVKKGDFWMIEMYYNGDFGWPEEMLISQGHRRIGHTDPHLAIVNDTTTSTGEIGWYRLSLAEVVAGKSYDHMAPPRYLTGDILGNDTSATRHVVARVEGLPDMAPVYTTYSAVKNGTRWEIPKFVNGELRLDSLGLSSQGWNLVDHVDPHFEIVTDETMTQENITYLGLSIGELLGGTRSFPPGETPGTGSTPYRPHTLPVRIEAEDYDLGGEGIAYHDTTPGNSGGAYRQDDVDIEANPSELSPNVGWVRDGEFLAYTITVPSTETCNHYWLTARVASPNSGRTVVISVDGVLASTIAVPNTGSFASYASVQAPIALSSGSHVLRMTFQGDGQNVNWFEFAQGGISPYKQHTIPGRIEAEDYDLGGEDIAYHDTTPGNSGGAYRQDDVDIETTAGEGTPNVGWVRNGEWLAYDVNVSRTGPTVLTPYLLTMRVASPYAGRTVALTLDGEAVGTIAVPNTGSFSRYTTVQAPVTLRAGQHGLKMTFQGDGQNVNWLEFSTGTVTTTPTTPAPSGEASFTAAPNPVKKGAAVKFTLTPTAGKIIRSAWWTFDKAGHYNTWNSRAVSPTFFYPGTGTFTPLVKIIYTDGSTGTVERANYIRVIT